MHSSLPTVGEIARRLRVSVHRIEYILRSRQIPPATYAGNLRVFSQDKVELIAAELERIASEDARPATHAESATAIAGTDNVCELCGQHPAEHFRESPPWDGKHVCTPCNESLPNGDENHD